MPTTMKDLGISVRERVALADEIPASVAAEQSATLAPGRPAGGVGATRGRGRR